MSTYRTWYLSLAAFLLLANPLVAQAQAEAPLKMIYAVWKDTTAAANTIKHMDKSAKDQIEAYAVLVKDKDGTVEARERYHKPTGPGTGVQASEAIDRAIARVSTPATSGADSASGYAAPAQPSHLSEEDLKKVIDMFGPGESALMLISAKPAVSQITRSLGMGADTDVAIVELEVKE